jgi:hypothetical protein
MTRSHRLAGPSVEGHHGRRSKPHHAPACDKSRREQRGVAPERRTNKRPKPNRSRRACEMATVSNKLDAGGWPWDLELHAATQSLTKTTAGLWRMKVGAKRPDPKPGFPKVAKPLDL